MNAELQTVMPSTVSSKHPKIEPVGLTIPCGDMITRSRILILYLLPSNDQRIPYF